KAACGRQDLGACSGPKPAPALGSGAFSRPRSQPFLTKIKVVFFFQRVDGQPICPYNKPNDERMTNGHQT
ncbi:hypothetical protein, partial [Ralstonia pickettii]